MRTPRHHFAGGAHNGFSIGIHTIGCYESNGEWSNADRLENQLDFLRCRRVTSYGIKVM
jgi:hypothetical protein